MLFCGVYQNIYVPVITLKKSPTEVGGLCKVFYILKRDVQKFPDVNPLTGIISSAIELKPGGTVYWCEAAESDRSFTEDVKESTAGRYLDIQVSAQLGGNSAANTLALDAMKFHQFILILHDRDGLQRLIGNEDAGATLLYDYKSGDPNGSRIRKLKWQWQHTNNAPIYAASNFEIVIDGAPITAGSMSLIQRFRVGDPSAPMAEGDTTFTNAGLAGKRILVIASGAYVPCDYGEGDIDFTGSIVRHVAKPLAGSTITWIGGVTDKEIIEIYAIN